MPAISKCTMCIVYSKVGDFDTLPFDTPFSANPESVSQWHSSDRGPFFLLPACFSLKTRGGVSESHSPDRVSSFFGTPFS